MSMNNGHDGETLHIINEGTAKVSRAFALRSFVTLYRGENSMY